MANLEKFSAYVLIRFYSCFLYDNDGKFILHTISKLDTRLQLVIIMNHC
jgi:hypothetical protein